MRSVSCMAIAMLLLPLSAKEPPPEYLKRAIVYQIVLRNFTRDGDFKAATAMLDHVRLVGVDVVYLGSFAEMDRDMDRSGWSKRQREIGFDSPKNPYRIADYGKVDPEYGTDEDFKAFCDRAHALGMRVYTDVVYLHCGPNNVLKDMYQDAFRRNADGTIKLTPYHFPLVNFESKAVRRYLIDAMLHWIDLGCDGCRCDVGDAVPIGFWMELLAACRMKRPDFVMINEGTQIEWLAKAFDAGYAFPWSFSVRSMLTPMAPKDVFAKEGTFSANMEEVRRYESLIPENARLLCFLDNHDTASDDGEIRFDRIRPVEAGNAAFVLTFLRRGLPLIYNGNEIADRSLNTFFAPVEHMSRARKTVDWGYALQPSGQKRLSLIKRLAEMRHGHAVFAEGSQEWVADGEKQGVCSFVRRVDGNAVFVAANLTDKDVSFVPSGVEPVHGEPLMAELGEMSEDGSCRLGPWGYVVISVK